LFQRFLYNDLGEGERSLLHGEIAVVLEQLYQGQKEEAAVQLAHHFNLAREWPKAIRYAVHAGERAQRFYASQQALEHYARAATWLDQGQVDWPAAEITRCRAGLLEKRGQVHSLLGEYKAAEAAFTQAWEAWEGLGDWRCTARVLNRLSYLHFAQDDYVSASRYAKLALNALPDTQPPGDLLAVGLTHLGLSAWARGRHDDALRSLEKALTLFKDVSTDLNGLARCLNSLGLVHLDRGDLELAEGCFGRSLTIRQQIGDRRGEAWCWHNEGRAAIARGDLVAARQKLETAWKMFSDIQHPYGLESCTEMLAELQEAN
jgi:tetratricopeptide (TPR) repeat protein